MSRTFKDKREVKAKRLFKAPEFKRRYRNVLENGFVDDLYCDICPDCGAEIIFERGFLFCEDCDWGSFLRDEIAADLDLEFSDAA